MKLAQDKTNQSGAPENIGSILDGTAPGEIYVDQIQHYLNIFPWEKIDTSRWPKINIPKNDGKPDAMTLQGLKQLQEIATELDLGDIVVPAINFFNSKDYYNAEHTLDRVINQIKKFINEGQSSKNIKNIPFTEKLNTFRSKKWPLYFPTPWGDHNEGSRVGGGKCVPFQTDGAGNILYDADGTPKVVDYESYRICTPPDYNVFLMWGPKSPRSGISGLNDPRRARAATKYPGVFSPGAIKKQLENDIPVFFIPSPGFSPYIEPPTNDLYYTDPNNPNPEEGKPKFFDEEDRELYYKYLELFNQYKEESLQDKLTRDYIEAHHKFYDTNRAAGITPTVTRISFNSMFDKLQKFASNFANLTRLICQG